ncbi:probable ethanolamine kinase isoform X2 [Dioscorea cayenensis subsp. rotundata]|uniref:ethanolamine kinase n=1 Tax=Dioscorea cayennensis subsp. rotundata TaxID=55577 RepID=A0AB40BJY6_DIOCR|nr:probable ethanolamine kinase isoform X2 [Dioscorea cayenensis subsp. rotundata]
MGLENKGRDLIVAMDGEKRIGGDSLERAVLAEIPTSHISIDISLSINDLKSRIIELCKDLFDKWSDLDDSHFSVETISGGITNRLLKASVRESSGNVVSLTIRLYGPNTDLVVDRKRELKAMPHLSVAGFGAELLGLFDNGMVQSFINARTLSAIDMGKPEVAVEIAKQLRMFHQVEVPGSKDPQLWNDIFKFYREAAELSFEDPLKQAKYDKISFEEVLEEVNILKDLTDQLKAPIVFAHNDLLCGNLMMNDAEGKLYFIDFEYGSYSYRGYDIANHFNEYAGYECDYGLYPDIDAQYNFFRHYLQPDKPYEVPDEDLRVLYVETNTYRLASHIYWALWAIIQAKMSPLDFNYLGYFFLRYSEYKKHKEASFQLAKKHLSEVCFS